MELWRNTVDKHRITSAISRSNTDVREQYGHLYRRDGGEHTKKKLTAFTGSFQVSQMK